MASNILGDFFLVFVVICAVPGLALRIIVNPPTFDERTEEVNVTCTGQGPGDWSQKILVLQIVKEGEVRLVVNIDINQRIKWNSGVRENVTAQGHVDSAADKSYLTLTLPSPSAEDIGTYTCEMFYEDQNSQIRTEMAADNVTFQECPDGWTPYQPDRTCLKVFATENIKKWLEWEEARKACQGLGGDLVVIKDAAKNAFVVDAIAEFSYHWLLWLGVHNVADSGYDFEYVDGSNTDSYHPWVTGAPNGDGHPGMKCVIMDTKKGANAGRWADHYCWNRRPYVCSSSMSARVPGVF